MDKGPWKAEVWKRATGNIMVIQSDDFEHDVALEISGDFEDWDQRKAYAEWLADALTRATDNQRDDGTGQGSEA